MEMGKALTKGKRSWCQREQGKLLVQKGIEKTIADAMWGALPPYIQRACAQMTRNDFPVMGGLPEGELPPRNLRCMLYPEEPAGTWVKHAHAGTQERSGTYIHTSVSTFISMYRAKYGRVMGTWIKWNRNGISNCDFERNFEPGVQPRHLAALARPERSMRTLEAARAKK